MLKTLNELGSSETDFVTIEELKQEAINQIGQVRKKRKELGILCDLTPDEERIAFAIPWIKHFFNITEDEVKDA